MNKMLIFLWAICLAATASGLGARLKFDKTLIAVSAVPGERYLRSTFKFVNDSNRSVVIKDLQTSCGCTVATANRREYAAGERGEIDVVLSVGDGEGVQNKQIEVTTNEGEDEPYLLTLRADLPKVVGVEPSFLFWAEHDSQEEKSVRITYNDAYPVKFVSVTDSNRRFKLTEESQLKGNPTLIKLVPIRSGKDMNSELVLSFSVGSQLLVRKVVLRVLPPVPVGVPQKPE